MSRLFLIMGAVNGGLSVACGAFAAHGLSGRLSAPALANFETAARYQMYHALALVAVAVLLTRDSSPAVARAGWSFVMGIVLFSGSLYMLSLTGQRWLGAVTPLGGVAFLAGWALLLFAGVGGRGR